MTKTRLIASVPLAALLVIAVVAQSAAGATRAHRRAHHPGVRAHAAYVASPIANIGSSGYCMSSLGTHTDGADAVIWACNGSANQSWINATASGGGTILQNQGDGWCLNNYEGLSANGNPQTMWPCDDTGGSANYKQSYVVGGSGLGSGRYLIQTVNSSDGGTDHCLSSMGYTFNGAVLVQYACNRTSPNQAWIGNTLTWP